MPAIGPLTARYYAARNRAHTNADFMVRTLRQSGRARSWWADVLHDYATELTRTHTAALAAWKSRQEPWPSWRLTMRDLHASDQYQGALDELGPALLALAAK